MSKKFPRDEFDSAPLQGGRHRARATAGQGWLQFAGLASSAALVSVAAYAGLKITDSGVVFEGLVSDNPGTTQSIKGESKGPSVAVLDGTAETGLAGTVADQLLAAGWNVLTAANLGPLGESAATTTKIVVLNEGYKTLATDLGKTIGDYPVEVGGSYLDPITIILGDDFQK